MGILKRSVLILVFFIYIFNISFVFLPSFFTTRIWLSVVGIFFLLFNTSDVKPLFKGEINVITSICVILIPSILTTVVNNNLDFRFFGYVIQNILLLVAAKYLVFKYKLDIYSCCKLIVYCVLIHNLLSLLMFLIPSLSTFIIGVQWLSENEVINNVVEYQSRFIGIGWGNFFFGGVICSVALLLCVFLYSIDSKKKWLLYYLFILITGLFIARIVLVGFILSVPYLIKCNNLNNRSNVKMYFGFVFLIILSSFYIFQNYEILLKSSSFRHAFEIFINFFDGKGMTSSSTQGLMDMFIFPKEFKTLMIGDGIFNLENGSYYMFTDVGYLRLLFYFGIFGVVLYFGPYIYIVKFLKRNNNLKEFYYLMLSLSLLLWISNVKGLVDLNWILFLFLYSNCFKLKY